jgi:hypothetical protein
MFKVVSILFLWMFFEVEFCQLSAQILSPEKVVQSNLNAYNNRDIDGFMSYMHPEIKIYTLGETVPVAVGLIQVRKMYQELFELSPQLHSTILNRMVFDNKVIDHERIVGRRGSPDNYELVLIYEVKDDKIVRITVMRKGV